MKLLFDQNLSPRLVALLSSEFPESAHVRNHGLATATDTTIWQFAAENGFAIVSKDVDFQQRALLRGFPPKVVWVRLGNCSTADVADLLRLKQSLLLEFESDPVKSFLEISVDDLHSD